MAKKKGGGGGQEQASKKTQQKKKQQIVEDKTFGLKNKNKSKKVQQHIRSVEKNVMNSGDPKLRRLEEQRKKAKAEAKLRKKAAQDEQDALFNEALMAVSKKTSTSQKDGKVEAKGRDAADDEDNNRKATSRAMKMMYQMDAQEMNEKLREDVSCCVYSFFDWWSACVVCVCVVDDYGSISFPSSPHLTDFFPGPFSFLCRFFTHSPENFCCLSKLYAISPTTSQHSKTKLNCSAPICWKI